MLNRATGAGPGMVKAAWRQGGEPDLAELSTEDVERLASRLALVVSEDGEAENAGRAMGQLARRLGMTGGQLKAIFLAGAAAGGEPVSGAESRELLILRKGLYESESKLRAAERERDSLLREVTGLRQSLRQTRASGRSRTAMAAVVIVVVIGAATISAMVPLNSLQQLVGMPLPLPPPADPRADISRTAVVHAAHAMVFQSPDRSAPVIATLPAGMPVVVRRLVWNMLMQWAEVEVGSSVGYVLTSDIDLS